MVKKFKMINLGSLQYFVRLEVKQDGDGNFGSQQNYANDMLSKFNMLNCDKTSIPMNSNEKLQFEDGTSKADATYFRQLIGGLNYLTHTHHDIAFPISLLSRFMHSPIQHLGTAKRIVGFGTLSSKFQIILAIHIK